MRQVIRAARTCLVATHARILTHEKMRRQLGAFFVNTILTRKSKNRDFCFFTQFAFAKACGKRVNFLPCYNSVCP